MKITAPGYTQVGGLIGSNYSGTPVVNSYWDVDATGIKTSAGGSGLTSAQMTSPASFSGWNIDTVGGQATTWRMYEGKAAPMLKAFLKPAEAYMTSKTFTYNGKSQAVDLLQWSGVDVDTSRLHYTTNAGEVTAKDVGVYDIYSYNFFSDPYGYDIVFHGPTSGKITVTPADLIVKPNDASKTYDGKAYGDSNGVTYTGFVNGETTGVLGGALVLDNGWHGAVNAGSYFLNASGFNSKNYNIIYQKGTLTVDKAALTVSAGNASKTYDGQQFIGGPGVVFDGFVNGETAGVLDGALLWSGSAQGAVNAGTYSILADGYASGNYEINYAPGTLTVDKATLVLGSTDVTKTYDGTLAADGRAVVVGGQLFGDDGLEGGDFSFADKNAGSGKTVIVGNVVVKDGNGGGNYEVSYLANTSSTIRKASLIVSANDASKTRDGQAYYGGNGVSYSGFVPGEGAENLGGVLQWGGNSQGAIGTGEYLLFPGGLTNGNYDIAYQSGKLTISQSLPYDNNGSEGNDAQQPVVPETGDQDVGGNPGNGGDTTPVVPHDDGTKIDDGTKAGDIDDVKGGGSGTGASNDNSEDGSEGKHQNDAQADNVGADSGSGSDSSTEAGACSGATAKEGGSATDQDCLIPAKARPTMSNA